MARSYASSPPKCRVLDSLTVWNIHIHSNPMRCGVPGMFKVLEAMLEAVLEVILEAMLLEGAIELQHMLNWTD